jgi:hypothetical protein
MEVQLYDEKGMLIEVADAYAENIKKLANFKISFWQASQVKAAEYMVSSVTCKKADSTLSKLTKKKTENQE